MNITLESHQTQMPRDMTVDAFFPFYHAISLDEIFRKQQDTISFIGKGSANT